MFLLTTILVNVILYLTRIIVNLTKKAVKIGVELCRCITG